MAEVSPLMERNRLSTFLGKQFDGTRDIYKALGWKKQIAYGDYEEMFRRHEVANAAIALPVTYCWETFPTIEESDQTDTPFETACDELVKRLALQRVFSRLDTLSSLGRYAVLLLGFNDDQADFEQPVEKAEKLIFVTPYPEGSVTITSTIKDKKDPRFGQPEIFTVTVGPTNATTQIKVHHSRVLYVAQDCLTNPLEGTPQLEVIYNRLYDLEKTVGGDAEAYWRSVFAGIVVTLDKDYEWGATEKQDFEDAISMFVHDMKRFITLLGAEANPIPQQIADPKEHFEMLLAMVAIGKRIPKRLLMGSELGELASSMDYVRWLRQVQSRREQFCETDIIRPFFDKLIQVGVLKRSESATKRYNVKWTDLLTPSDKDKAEVGEILSRAVAAYLNAGADSLIPIEVFAEKWLGRPTEEVEQMIETMNQQVKDLDLPNLDQPTDSLPTEVIRPEDNLPARANIGYLPTASESPNQIDVPALITQVIAAVKPAPPAPTKPDIHFTVINNGKDDEPIVQVVQSLKSGIEAVIAKMADGDKADSQMIETLNNLNTGINAVIEKLPQELASQLNTALHDAIGKVPAMKVTRDANNRITSIAPVEGKVS
jgi:hypothetical protein